MFAVLLEYTRTPHSRSVPDPFAKTVPDHVDSVLSYGVEDATVCSFDKRGTYLAVGYATGVVVIWDFVTRRVSKYHQDLGVCGLPCMFSLCGVSVPSVQFDATCSCALVKQLRQQQERQQKKLATEQQHVLLFLF